MMKAQKRKRILLDLWERLHVLLEFKEVVRAVLVLLFPALILLLIKRNDLSLKEDLARLCIFTACTALGWCLTLQKRSRHAQLRKPLLLESPPEKL